HNVGDRDKCRARIIAPSIFDGEVLAFSETQRVQLSQKGLMLRDHPWGVGAGAENADAPDLARLLRARRERPRCSRAAEQRDELTPFHCPMPPVLRTETIA